jgi:hypothetical protein
MVADKHKMEASKASALGMLSPKVGITALGSVLGGLGGGSPASAVVGAAGAVYWHKLLANYKPLPPMFTEVMATAKKPQPAAQKVLNAFQPQDKIVDSHNRHTDPAW